MTRTLGTCSNCGGAVCVPSIWHGTVPPTPTCSQCGAQPRHAHGPVIDMKPPTLQQRCEALGRASAERVEARLEEWRAKGRPQ